MENFIWIDEVKGETDNLKIDDSNLLESKLKELYINPEDASVDIDPINWLLDAFNNEIENWVTVNWKDKSWDELDESVRGKLKEVNGLINDYINSWDKATIILSTELWRTLDVNNLDFVPNKSWFERLISELKERWNNFLKEKFMPDTQKNLRWDRNAEILAQLWE